MIHLPADYYTKPILRSLGIYIHADTKCRAICGALAPGDPMQIVEGPMLPGVPIQVPYVAGHPEETIGGFRFESNAEADRREFATWLKTSPTDEWMPWQEQLFEKALELPRGKPRGLSIRWFGRPSHLTLTLPRGAGVIAEQLAIVNCAACLVALDALGTRHTITIRLAPVPDPIFCSGRGCAREATVGTSDGYYCVDHDPYQEDSEWGDEQRETLARANE